MTQPDRAGDARIPSSGAVPPPAPAAVEVDEGEVPGGYTDRGGSDRCDECIFFTALEAGADARGHCLVHGPPAYLVVAGGWCPAWEPLEGDLPVFR